MIPQYDLLKSFGTPTTKLKIDQKVLVPLLQLYSGFRTPNIEQKKFQREELNSFLKLCLRIMFSNIEIILI